MFCYFIYDHLGLYLILFKYDHFMADSLTHKQPSYYIVFGKNPFSIKCSWNGVITGYERIFQGYGFKKGPGIRI